MSHLSGEVARRCEELAKLPATVTWALLAKDDGQIRKLYAECSALNDGKLEAYNGLADRLSGTATKSGGK